MHTCYATRDFLAREVIIFIIHSFWGYLCYCRTFIASGITRIGTLSGKKSQIREVATNYLRKKKGKNWFVSIFSSPTGLVPEVPLLQAFENEVGRGWTRLIIATLTIICLCFSLLELSLPLHTMVRN